MSMAGTFFVRPRHEDGFTDEEQAIRRVKAEKANFTAKAQRTQRKIKRRELSIDPRRH